MLLTLRDFRLISLPSTKFIHIYIYIHTYIYIIYIYNFFTGKCKSKAQSEFKIIFLIESVLMFCMTCLGFCFRHYSLNLGFSFM